MIQLDYKEVPRLATPYCQSFLPWSLDVVGLHLPLAFCTHPLCTCSTIYPQLATLSYSPFCTLAHVTDLANNASLPSPPRCQSSQKSSLTLHPCPVFQFHNAYFWEKEPSLSRCLAFYYTILPNSGRRRDEKTFNKTQRKTPALDCHYFTTSSPISKGQERHA